ncbi:MAG: hypothetical protein AB7T49_19935 [Oligoflexales bacterium]
MEVSTNQKVAKTKLNTVSTVPLRVKRETKRRIQAELAKVNKKPFGRKVRVDALVSRALNLLTDADIKALQEASLFNADRLEMAYLEHVKKHGSVTKDEFLGKLLSQEIHANS